MKIKLAFIGDSFCRRGQCRQTDTFIRILEKHYGPTVEFVIEGREGGSDLTAKLSDLDRAFELKADIIFVFYEPQNQTNTAVYQEEQRLIYQKLQNHPRVWHFQDRQSQNLLQQKQPVNREFMNYAQDWYAEYRHCVPHEVSDNGIDAAGNRKIARELIRIIDEYQQSLVQH